MHIFQIKQVSAEVSVQFVKVSLKLNDLLLNHEGAYVSVWIKCPWGPVFFWDKMWNGFSKSFYLTFQCSCLCLYPSGSATVPNGMATKMWGTAFMKTFCRSDFNMFEKWTLMPQSTCALLILEHSGQLIFAVAASSCFALSLYCYLLLNGMTVMSICAQALWVIPQSKNSCNVTFISFHWYWTKDDKTQFVKQKLIYSQWKDDSA